MKEMVYDFLSHFCDPNDQEVAIYDLTTDKEIYRGTRKEMSSVIQTLRICSIDTLHEASKVLTLNVET